MTDTTVLIVGAGPTGLTLACELASRGVPFRIVEAAPGPQPGSRGKGLQPRTLEVFEDLEIVDTVLEHGRIAMPMVSHAPDGTSTVGGEVPESLRDRPDVPYAASLIIPEWRVEEALRDRLRALGAEVEFGTALVEFSQTADTVRAEPSTVRAVLARGDETETVDVRWLVGCDGGHSIVRKRSGIEFVGETLEDVRMIVADVAVEGLDRDAWHLWRGERGMASLCPLPSTDLFQLQAGVRPGQDPDLGLANLQRVLDEVSGGTAIRLVEAVWTTLWRANIRLVDRYRDGNVFLAGDAAHIHSPAGGQGMNTGVQDAANLGWKLAAVVGGAPDSLLDTYGTERRPVAEHVLALSNARLRETIRTNEVSTKRDASTIQLDVGYRGSVLAEDDRGSVLSGDEVLRAGDRAPDATGLAGEDGAEHRLFDLVRGGRWTLVDFGAGGAPADTHGVRVLRMVRQASAPDEIVDTNGSLARAYDAQPQTLVLVRPDGYVGAISDAGDDAAIARYLERVAGA